MLLSEYICYANEKVFISSFIFLPLHHPTRIMFLHHVFPFLREHFWRTTVLTIRVHSQKHHRLILQVKIIKIMFMQQLNQIKLIFFFQRHMEGTLSHNLLPVHYSKNIHWRFSRQWQRLKLQNACLVAWLTHNWSVYYSEVQKFLSIVPAELF